MKSQPVLYRPLPTKLSILSKSGKHGPWIQFIQLSGLMPFIIKYVKTVRSTGKRYTRFLGVNLEGRKEVLGLYVSENEGANFWLQVLTDLSNRGVTDILIACVDGLKGFPEAIEAIFPETEVQLCIVHQIRNSLKYVGSKNQKEFMVDLKRVYKAINKDLAEQELDTLADKWNDKYPHCHQIMAK